MVKYSRLKKKQVSPAQIHIYTTKELVALFAARAASQNRSLSQHAEYLLKQDLAAAQTLNGEVA